MEKTRKNNMTDANMYYHIKVLYGIVLLLLVILMGEIWIYYKRLYDLQSQINTIALSQHIVLNDQRYVLNSSELHTLNLIELDQYTNSLLHYRVLRNKRDIIDKMPSSKSVSIYSAFFSCSINSVHYIPLKSFLTLLRKFITDHFNPNSHYYK